MEIRDITSNENWMSSLPECVRNVPVINIAIPGSHNSMTYAIDRNSKIAPDADSKTRRINCVLPVFVRRWAITQSADVEEQLLLGIRYFDLRVCLYENKFHFTHGLLAMEIFEPLEKIRNFLNTHPKEVVVLDFQHFYALSLANHQYLHSKLIGNFSSMLFKRSDGPLSKCSLNLCQKMKRQVILVYRQSPIQLPIDFWPSCSWPTPWPNVVSVKKLQQILDEELLERPKNSGFVSQCIITPTPKYISFRFLSSLKGTAKNVNKKLHEWIISQRPGKIDQHGRPTANVFIADFVELNCGQFCDWVINLNSLLNETKNPSGHVSLTTCDLSLNS